MSGNKTLQGSAGALSDVDSTQRNPLGFEVPDEQGNMYKYVSGVASVAAGDWVVLNSDGTIARAVSTPLAGPVGVAMSAIVAGKFGWVQIIGYVNNGTTGGNGAVQSNIASDAAADKKPLYLSATAGRLTTTQAAGQAVLGAWGSGAAVSNVGSAWISRPFAAGFTLASA